MRQTKEDLVMNNMGLVYHTVMPFTSTLGNEEDVFQMGKIGLIKAANAFDESKNIKFATFAVTCIRNEMLCECTRQKKRVNAISYDTIIHTNGKGDPVFLSDMIADDACTEDNIMRQCDIALVREAVRTLKDDERKAVTLLYGLEGKRYNQDKVAEIMGLSQSWVSRLKLSALKKMRQYIDSRW